MMGLLRDLRQVVVGGEGDPPVPSSRFWRWVVRAGLWLSAIAVALYAIDFGSGRELPTSLVVLAVLSAVPLVVVGYRPLLAWRMAWVLALASLVIGETSGSCQPSCDPPWSLGQLLACGIVLFGVGLAQRPGVLWWVWLATAALIMVSADARTELATVADQVAAQLLLAGLLVGGYLLQRWLPRHEPEVAGPSWPGAVTWVRARVTPAALHDWFTSDLRRAFAGGPDDPPVLGGTARFRRYVRIGLWAAVFLIALGAASAAADGEDWAQEILWPLSPAPLALVLYRPLLAWRVGWLLGLLGLLLAEPEGHQFHYSPALIWVVLVILSVVGTVQPPGVLVWVWLGTVPLALSGVDPGGRPGAVVVVTGVLLAGYQVQRRRQARHHLAEAQERGTVLTERARIARELHDVVAHHMSMIAVRTETAPFRLGDLPESARTELAEISQASREALTEMRRLLGVLRSDEPAPLTAPQPGLGDLPELVAAARAAGAEVTMDIDATLPELPAAVDVSAYRIVQEALTNAARHALGAPVRVVVGRSAGGLALSIRNGPGAVPGEDAGPGHGVRGMRERAAMLGGELRAGPAGDGGFEVSALVPLPETP